MNNRRLVFGNGKAEIFNSRTGQIFRAYELNGIQTIGAYGNEPYGIRFRNGANRVQIKISIDGRNVLTGLPANLSPHSKDDCFIVGPYDSPELIAWPETTQGGAQFIFTDVPNSVAAHTPGDLSALGYISIAVFKDTAPPVTRPRVSYGGLVPMGAGRREPVLEKSVGTGAGDFVEQHIGSAVGLVRPVLDYLIQIRYLWYTDLVTQLQKANIKVPQASKPAVIGVQGHPTGFESIPLANLRDTPRQTTRTQEPQDSYPRFV